MVLAILHTFSLLSSAFQLCFPVILPHLQVKLVIDVWHHIAPFVSSELLRCLPLHLNVSALEFQVKYPLCFLSHILNQHQHVQVLQIAFLYQLEKMVLEQTSYKKENILLNFVLLLDTQTISNLDVHPSHFVHHLFLHVSSYSKFG